MADISSEQAKSYLDRWRLVHEVEARELRNVSLVVKGRQLAILMASRDLFGTDTARDREVEVVRERWARIRDALHG